MACPAVSVCGQIGNARPGCYSRGWMDFKTVAPCLSGVIILLGRAQNLLTQEELEVLREKQNHEIGFQAPKETLPPGDPAAP